MQEDPHEKNHCTTDPEHATDLAALRQVFESWFPAKPGGNAVPKRKEKD